VSPTRAFDGAEYWALLFEYWALLIEYRAFLIGYRYIAQLHCVPLCPDRTQGSFHMRWLRLVGSIKLQVSFAKEPYKRDNMLQKRPVI